MGGRPGPGRRPANARPGRHRDHRRDDRGGPEGAAHVTQADLIWMNGELIPGEDAKVPVLTHALHYGTGVFEGIRAYETPRGTAVFPAAKATGQYLNSVLAKIEATKAGYEECILLDQRGMVCEGTGENLFVVRDGRIATPGFASGILGGITRLSVMQIARDLGYEIVERDIARGELYVADEIFMTGTAAELTPLREIDDHPVGTGRPGEITRAIQQEFEDALHGRSERYAEWLDVVPQPAPAPAT